ncbi:unnamed protein product [Rotaria sordida]|uniref:PARP catalytic domain-containing protein n=1 Tax=Rotaria sordida TaxID=392033 RepID=A0A815B1D8_9BILA|nr:unnamed protein product [Rotaria sordida]CAF1265829.1 unnamed protein product [Rotaria sordida]
MGKVQNERKKLEEEVKQFKDKQNKLKQIKTGIHTVNYEKISSQLVDNYLLPNHNLLLYYLKNLSTKMNPQSTNYPPQIIFEKNQTMYTIAVTGFQYHHDQFKIILQRIQSVNNSMQSAKDYYQQHLNRIIRSLMITFLQVQSKTRYWLLYKNIFSNNIKEKIKEYVSMFNISIEEQIKTLIEQCISSYQLKHLELIPPLLQRIIIYYCCFTLQLPLFESTKDLIDKIEKNTIITITTPTGSGHGAYFADNPQKSHKYTKADENDQTRVIFYAKVLLGIPSVQNKDNSNLTSASIGSHSVQGTGDDDEEYIVYRYGQALHYLKIIYKIIDV